MLRSRRGRGRGRDKARRSDGALVARGDGLGGQEGGDGGDDLEGGLGALVVGLGGDGAAGDGGVDDLGGDEAFGGVDDDGALVELFRFGARAHGGGGAAAGGACCC